MKARPFEAWVVCRTCQAGFPCLAPGAAEFVVRHMSMEEKHEVAWVPRYEARMVISKQHKLRGEAA